MADNISSVSDMLSAPMEEVIVSLATGIARAQRELDRYAMDAQREIDEDPQLSEAGLQATFYQFPRAELELTIAIALQANPPAPAPAGPGLRAINLGQIAAIRQIHLQPVNAAYSNQFNYDVNASSKLKLVLVPVPPPGADGAITPKMKQEDVLKAAAPNLVQNQAARLSVNFNGRNQLWTVLQYLIEGNVSTRLALVVIDDQTGQVIKAVKGA